MQKPELLDHILELKRQRLSNKQIALQLQCHRNTVCKYVKYIRANLVKTPEEIVNKIDDKLEDELEDMSHKDLIAYRRALVPERIEQHVKVENDRGTAIASNLREYEPLITEELKRTLRTDSATKQVDSAQATPEASPVPTT